MSIKHNLQNVLAHLCPRLLVTYWYWRISGHLLNWRNPKDINEKIQWLKFNSSTNLWSIYSDKLRVRDHIKELGLTDMLVPLYGSWDNAEDINWENLPNQFAMKTNHGSGDVLICKDKSALDTEAATKYFAKKLKERFGLEHAEPHYDKITPCVIAEQLLDASKQNASSCSLIDYKIWAFNGKPAYILVCADRKTESLSIGVYDLNWNFHPEYTKKAQHCIPMETPLPRPKSLDRMIEAAALLSTGFAELRVDFYDIDGHPYFGEMTFSSAMGLHDYYTEDFLKKLGDLTILTPKECK